MWTSEKGEYEEAMNRINYPKPKCKTPYCGKDVRSFNNGLCYSCGLNTETKNIMKTPSNNQEKKSVGCDGKGEIILNSQMKKLQSEKQTFVPQDQREECRNCARPIKKNTNFCNINCQNMFNAITPQDPFIESVMERFDKEFGDRFLDIARMADKGDDKGYGKGLARLQIEIKSFIKQALAEQREGFRRMVEEKRAEEIEKVPQKEERDRIYNLANENMVFGYNQALADILNSI